MQLDFSKLDGLVPAVIQDAGSGRVLMLGFMNAEAFAKSVETGCVTFYSRTRRRLWCKGETSGHILRIHRIETDCDQDALLLHVDAEGAGVCHAGYRSCFYRTLSTGKWVTTDARSFDPARVYGSKA